MNHRHHLFCGWILGTLGALLGASAAWAGEQAAAADARAQYQKDVAICNSGQPQQDYATCMRDAGAAFEAARKGKLDEGAAPYQRNAERRCDPLPDSDRAACLARLRGQGITRGSVKEGGIYRELHQVFPADSASAPQPARMP